VRDALRWLESDDRAAGFVRIALSVGAFLLLWWLLTATVVTNRMILVPPLDVLAALVKEFSSGAITKNAAATGLAVAVSFPVAVILGVLMGVALASNRLLTLTAGPLLTAMYSVPVVALAPLFIAWLGLGFASKFVIVVLVSVFPVIVNTEVGLRSTDKAFIDAAKSFNATPTQIFTTVTFPFALPFIIGGVRVAWARSLVGIVVAEFFGAFAGFGFAIMAASQTFNTGTLLGYVVLLGLMGLLGSVFLTWLERTMAPWRQET
jgi:ABC-type nitrate/sulfonate/bicarbonate transport system permease component